MNQLLTLSIGMSTMLLCAAARPVDAQEWSLEACTEYALQHNRELLAGDAGARASSLGEKAARAALLPEVTGTAGMDHYWKIPVQVLPGELIGQPPGTFVPVRFGTPWMGDYGVEASLDVANPATWQQVKLAAIRARMARDEQGTVERMLRRNVRMAHHAAALGRHRHALVQSRLGRLQEVHALLAQQFEQGLVGKIGLNQSQALVNNLAAAEKAAQTAYRSALVDLKFWMGYPLGDTLSVAALAEMPPEQAPEGSFSPNGLPEYGRLRANADLAWQEWRASRAALLPGLSVVAGYRRLGFGASLDEITGNDWFPSGFVGLRLRVPILSIGNMAYAPKRQRVLAEAAELELERYRTRETSRLMREHLELEKARESMRIHGENVALARENERLAVQKLEKGIIDMVELKQAQQELDQAIEALIEARLDYLAHQVEIHYLQNNP